MLPGPASSTHRICLLRLSAIGDVAHTVAVVRTLQAAFPAAQLTWVVGRVESAVAALVPGVELIVVDKRRPWRELLRVRQMLAGRRFDVLLHMQVSFRSNLLSLGVTATRRVGFDTKRSKEGHGLVVSRRIPAAPPPGEHVLDGLMRFAAILGASQPVRRWDLEIPAEAQEWANRILSADRKTLVVNTCASRPVKDWRAERFAEVIRHATAKHRLQVVLCGGPTDHERTVAAAIASGAGVPVQNLVGATTLPQLLAILQRSVAVVSPDSGPVHLATAVGTPVLGLYGATNIRRCGPSIDQRWSIAKRDEAAVRLLGKPAEDLGWAEVVPGGMDLIEAHEVCERLDALLAATGATSP